MLDTNWLKFYKLWWEIQFVYDEVYLIKNQKGDAGAKMIVHGQCRTSLFHTMATIETLNRFFPLKSWNKLTTNILRPLLKV